MDTLAESRALRKAGKPGPTTFPPSSTAPGNNTVQIYPAPFAVAASATFPGKADGRNDQRRGVETQFFSSGQQ